MIEVDARGLSCPLPVLNTRKAIEQHAGEEIAVLVDTMASVENVTRMAENMGLRVSQPTVQGGEYRILIGPK